MTSLRSSLFISQPCVSWISHINQGNLDLCGIYSVQGNSNWCHRVSMLAIIYNTLIITSVRLHHNTASCQSKHVNLLSRAKWYIIWKPPPQNDCISYFFLYEQYYYYPFSSSVFHFQDFRWQEWSRQTFWIMIGGHGVNRRWGRGQLGGWAHAPSPQPDTGFVRAWGSRK